MIESVQQIIWYNNTLYWIKKSYLLRRKISVKCLKIISVSFCYLELMCLDYCFSRKCRKCEQVLTTVVAKSLLLIRGWESSEHRYKNGLIREFENVWKAVSMSRLHIYVTFCFFAVVYYVTLLIDPSSFIYFFPKKVNNLFPCTLCHVSVIHHRWLRYSQPDGISTVLRIASRRPNEWSLPPRVEPKTSPMLATTPSRANIWIDTNFSNYHLAYCFLIKWALGKYSTRKIKLYEYLAQC